MKLLEIYNGTLFECQMIKNLLENEGIVSIIKDEFIGTRSATWRPGGGVKLVVQDTDYALAGRIVKEFELKRKEEL